MGRYPNLLLFSPLLVSLPSFSGEPEIMALCELLNVNCVVWELRQQYAEVIFQFQRPGRTPSVHLHYASRRHYENTDIPKVNLFQFFKKHLTILFTYIFSGLLSSCCSCSFLQKNFSPATTKSFISINHPFPLGEGERETQRERERDSERERERLGERETRWERLGDSEREREIRHDYHSLS